MLKSKADWIFSEQENGNNPTMSMIEEILQNRGIHTLEEKEKFLHPNLNDLNSPSNLAGIKIAKERILKGIECEEYIMICGDYDADGITSTALLMNVFMDLGARCDYYIPNRFQDGYGLNKRAIQQFKDNGVSLIITVDNGIANIEEVKFANEIGIDIIVTDHHECQEQLPDAVAIIHPKLSDDYPCKELAGVGVAFQLAHALLEEMPLYLLELVAIGTIADMVPLTGDNRILVYYGLKMLHQSDNIGLMELRKICGIDVNTTINETDIGFKIAPRLNAVGRLTNASLAVDLLLTMDIDQATLMAAEIEELNTERKKIVEKIVDEAINRVSANDGVIMLYDESWHEGVLGIAASRLMRIFDRPVILLTYKKEEKILKGSGRSIPKFHLFNNGMKIRSLFSQFGGHSQAAGMTFPIENFESIQKALNTAIFEQLTKEDFKQEINHIHTIQWGNMTETFVNQVQKLAPFGMGNEEPIFHFSGIPQHVRQLGQHQQHLKLQFKEDTYSLDVIGFQLGNAANFISEAVTISIVGTLQMNEWNGQRKVQMMLKDLAINEFQLFDYRAKQQEKFYIPFFDYVQHAVVLGNSYDHLRQIVGANEHIDIITYDDILTERKKVEILFICDLPSNLGVLQSMIEHINPQSIHVSYHVTEDAFLQTVPHRDDFKWLYGYLLKYEPIQLKTDLLRIIKLKKWTKEKIIFMLKVFIDLKFIQVRDNIIYVNEKVVKTPLQKSITYQYRLQQSNIEKILYYSSYDELKNWFLTHINQDVQMREEVTNES